ncbi:MAG TPA: histidine phosphatase family protein [Anaeromyxobacteraceae bacterium]|nr:histidine phosphatase family protein [Anaeromyxobacteraceae bacterium]
MVQLWLIRHGETAWSLSGKHTGRTDVPLTPRGERQAEMLARRIAGKTFARVFTSPLSRARDTCRLSGHIAEAQVEPDLVEWNYGAFEGRTTADIQKDVPGWSIWAGALPGGETPEEVGSRADRVIAVASAFDGDVALFAHGHVLRILAARWLKLPAVGGRYLALDTASLSVLGHEHGLPVIQSWNESYDLVEVP